MGSEKNCQKNKFCPFLPILDAVADFLLIINSKHPTHKLGFRETLGFARYCNVLCSTIFQWYPQGIVPTPTIWGAGGTAPPRETQDTGVILQSPREVVMQGTPLPQLTSTVLSVGVPEAHVHHFQETNAWTSVLWLSVPLWASVNSGPPAPNQPSQINTGGGGNRSWRPCKQAHRCHTMDHPHDSHSSAIPCNTRLTKEEERCLTHSVRRRWGFRVPRSAYIVGRSHIPCLHGSTMPQATEGLLFPITANGDRSTTTTGKNIWAAAVGSVDEALAQKVQSERDWRHQYPSYLMQILEAALRSPINPINIARCATVSPWGGRGVGASIAVLRMAMHVVWLVLTPLPTQTHTTVFKTCPCPLVQAAVGVQTALLQNLLRLRYQMTWCTGRQCATLRHRLPRPSSLSGPFSTQFSFGLLHCPEVGGPMTCYVYSRWTLGGTSVTSWKKTFRGPMLGPHRPAKTSELPAS